MTASPTMFGVCVGRARFHAPIKSGEPPMSNNVSDFLLHRLTEWGIERLYGFPGDGINGLMGALDRTGDKFKLVRARHEEMCAFMACAHAKFTGEVGVCMATSGPGAIHFLTGFTKAKLAPHPVVPSSASRRARRSAASTSRRSIWFHCSRTLP